MPRLQLFTVNVQLTLLFCPKGGLRDKTGISLFQFSIGLLREQIPTGMKKKKIPSI
jgi:hypothetical protein